MLHCLRCLRCLGLALGAPVASVAGTMIGGTEGTTGEIGRIDRAGEVMCAPSRKQYTRTERAALNELVCASVCRCASHKPFHERGIRPRVWKLLLLPIRESCGLFALPVFGPRLGSWLRIRSLGIPPVGPRDVVRLPIVPFIKKQPLSDYPSFPS